MPLAATKPVYDAICSAGADLGGVHNFGGYALNSFRLEKVSWCCCWCARGVVATVVEWSSHYHNCLSLLTLAGLPSAGL